MKMIVGLCSMKDSECKKDEGRVVHATAFHISIVHYISVCTDETSIKLKGEWSGV